MSQEDLDAVKTLFVAFAGRDLDAVARVLDPKVEIRPAIVGGPERVVYRGLSGNSDFWADIDAAWAEFRTEPEEFRDLGDVSSCWGAPSLAAAKAVLPSTNLRRGSLSCVKGKSSASRVSATSVPPSNRRAAGGGHLTALPCRTD